MELKVYNRHNQILCTYVEGVRFPTESEIDSMVRAEMIFKLNGKKITAKKLKIELKDYTIKEE